MEDLNLNSNSNISVICFLLAFVIYEKVTSFLNEPFYISIKIEDFERMNEVDKVNEVNDY